MANIILFTDRSPLTKELNGQNIQFERYSRPAGAYKIASVLRDKGYTVLVVPNCLRLSLHAIQNFIDANSKDLLWIGVSTTFLTVRSDTISIYRQEWTNSKNTYIDLEVLNNSQYIKSAQTELAWGTTELLALSDHISKKYNAHVLVGGTWVSHIKNGGLDNSNANIHLIPGHAEDYVITFTESLLGNKPLPFHMASLEGEKDFKSSNIIYTPHDYVDSDEWLSIEISRGCAFKCAYCVYDHKGKADTTKHTKSLREEILRNYEEYGVTKYHLLDDLYNDSDYKIKLLYDEVWSKLPFKPEWISYLRLDLIWSNPDSAEWIKESGCKLGCFGIETLHDKAGKFVGKGLGKKRIIETLEFLKNQWKDDVLVNALMIAGLPYEPYDHIVETMEWLKTTDLVHSYKYSALWVTPPEHKPFVLKQNTMSNDYEKYQLTWGPDGWINNMGITFKMISELVAADDQQHFSNWYPPDLIEYPELRSIGYTHKDLANKTNNISIVEDLTSKAYPINTMIGDRLSHILKIRD
jgi:sulfatase maturation enzyme AslB (radical SAM superfamily)